MPKIKLYVTVVVFAIATLAVFHKSTPSALAAPAQQIDEIRNFDARIITGPRAQDCRTGEIIGFTDLYRMNGLPHPLVNHFYHFQNAHVWEGDPGVLYLLEIESPGLQIWEISGCPPVPAPVPIPARATIRTDKNAYNIGDNITVCWSVSSPGTVELIDKLPNGTTNKIYSQYDNGSGGCITGSIDPPPGAERLQINLYSGNRVIATAETGFTILAAAPPSGPITLTGNNYDNATGFTVNVNARLSPLNSPGTYTVDNVQVQWSSDGLNGVDFVGAGSDIICNGNNVYHFGESGLIHRYLDITGVQDGIALAPHTVVKSGACQIQVQVFVATAFSPDNTDILSQAATSLGPDVNIPGPWDSFKNGPCGANGPGGSGGSYCGNLLVTIPIQ